MLKLLRVIESMCNFLCARWWNQTRSRACVVSAFIVNNASISGEVWGGGSGRFKQGNVESCMKYDIIIPTPTSRREFARDIFLK